MKNSFLIGLLYIGWSLTATASDAHVVFEGEPIVYKDGLALEKAQLNASKITQQAKAAKELPRSLDKSDYGKIEDKHDFFVALKNISVGKTTVMELLVKFGAPRNAVSHDGHKVTMYYFPPHWSTSDAYYRVELDAEGKVTSVEPDGGP